SAYWASRGFVVGPVPPLDLSRERALQQLCLAAIRRGVLRSAHDLSDGGLGVALAEACILGELGLVSSVAAEGDAYRWLFNEAQSRILVSVRPDQVGALQSLAAEHGVPCQELGVVGGNRLQLGVVDVGLADLATAWQLDL
ncbi:MAG TPA: AIR synthase-related protein, partial [Chloroflexota bacterium]